MEDIENLERELIVKGEFYHGQRLSEETAKNHGLQKHWKIYYGER